MAVVPLASRKETLNPDSTRYQSAAGASEDAFGSGRGLANFGKSISNVGDDLHRIVLRNQIEDNERNAKDLEVLYRNGVRDILYGDGSQEKPGLYGLNGEKALAAAPEAQKQLTKLREELTKSAANSRSAEMFGVTSGLLESQNLEGVARFTVSQREIANEATSVARMQGADDDAAAGWNDPKVLNTSIATKRAEVFDIADRKGLSEEATAQLLKEEQSKTYEAAITSAMTQSPDKAMEMFNQYKGGLTAVAAAKLGAQVQEIGSTYAAQALADDIWSRPISYSEKLKAARDEASGEVENKLLDHLHTQWAESRSVIEAGRADFNFSESVKEKTHREIVRKREEEAYAEKQATKEARESALSAVNGGMSREDWQRLNPDAAQLILQTDYWDNLRSIEDAVIKGNMFAHVTDNKTYSKLYKESIEDPSAFVETDLSLYQKTMTEAENRQILARQATIKQKVDVLSTDSAVVNNAINVTKQYTPQLKWDAAEISPKQLAKQNAIQDQMTAWVAEQVADGKRPSQEEVRKQATSLALKVQSDPDPEHWDLSTKDPNLKSWEGIGAQTAYMSEEQRANAIVASDDIPASVLSDIRATIKKYQRQETKELIEALAGATATGDVIRARALLGIK